MRPRMIPAAAAVALLLAAQTAQAESAPKPASQDWIPAAIELPADLDVTVDRAIGSSTRIFRFTTHEDGASLIARWTDALETAGFQIEEPNPDLDVEQIEFSGPGIGNAKISIQPSAKDGMTAVLFDASLDE
ncbi:MAG: hypothetical protein KDA73_05830 [Rhodobacteraceae bacterium]|nr:hypothetical protein [Paracoccaceae bacterium]